MLCLLAVLSLAKVQHLNLIPYPVEVTVGEGQFELTSESSIYYDNSISDAETVANLCATFLRKVTGFKLPVTTSKISNGISFELISTEREEEYHITTTNNLFTIQASTRKGLFNGYQTLLQLLPVDVFADSVVMTRWITPIVTIVDYPRFSWRGFMLDSSRHFLNLDAVKSILDGMALNKMNVFHFHFVDDQGWRVEIKKYPKLVEVGSVRKSSPVMWHRDEQDHKQYGPFYYTQDELRELVKYAQDRNIIIVPEIEMPGHTLAGLAAYPEYSCNGGPFEPWCYWGVSSDVFCAGNDATFTFLQDILEEVFDIFSNTVYIHVGGDECPKGRWQNCAKCQKRIKDEGLKNENELESWFIEKMAGWVRSKGRQLIGWDEIMDGGIPENAIVMAWTSSAAGQKAARAGTKVIMADWGSLYLPRYQFPSPLDPYEYNNNLVTTRRVYNYNPTSGLDEESAKNIIGTQTSLWSEYVWGSDDLQWKTFPRSCALAEVAWSPDDRKDWLRFAKVVTEYQIPRLQKMGLNVAGLTAQPNAEWLKNEVPEKWVTVQWPVTDSVDRKGQFEILFVKNGGTSSLKIRNVKLLFDQTVVGNDDHEGLAADVPEKTVYSINQQTAPTTGGKIFISAEVCSVDGTDSHGHVYIYHT
ncbi:Beta-hexosaminidase [Tritrichomonas foetus]|uniref:beta-N-acetylhexosaminidase n=1 Tax=Tritrichomonas foetus TaxID=1144522 RepID=A0A1J4JEP6_9EUKA|nr:Beta-hexosaminidase [Tritrichomonas foetus]|eukprot:OHS96767.1 Beta-hexosaminidase [Tritrichomonas foetus]